MQNSQNNRAFSTLGILTFVLALLAAIALAAGPAISTLLMSFKDYRPARGLLTSPFVGLRNYQTVLQDYSYGLSVLHSAQFAALSCLALLITSTLVGYALRALSAVRWLRHALCTLLLVPLLVPGELWAQAFFAVFPSTAVQSLAALAWWCGIKYVGLAALLTTAALSHGNRSAAVPALSAGAMALGLFALLGLQDYAFLRVLPTVSAMEGSLDLFVYPESISLARFSVASAITVSAIALRAVLLATVAFPVGALVKRLFPANAEAAGTTVKDRALSLLAAGAVALGVALAATAAGAPAGAMTGKIVAAYPVYVLLALVGATVNAALCFCLARPLVTAKPAGRVAITAVLLALTALGAIPMSIGEYMQFRAYGIVDTYFSILLSGLGSTMGVWALVFAARAMGVHTNGQWFRRMWRPALALLAVAAALRMNDTLPSTLYLIRPVMQHPLLLLINMMSGEYTVVTGDLPLVAISSLISLLTMAVPAALLLVVRTVFTEKETVGLALPRK